jgi:hypothetical protein
VQLLEEFSITSNGKEGHGRACTGMLKSYNRKFNNTVYQDSSIHDPNTAITINLKIQFNYGHTTVNIPGIQYLRRVVPETRRVATPTRVHDEAGKCTSQIEQSFKKLYV